MKITKLNTLEGSWGGVVSYNGSLADWFLNSFEKVGAKEAVFDCDGNKSPGPDGFTLNLYQQCWDTIEVIL